MPKHWAAIAVNRQEPSPSGNLKQWERQLQSSVGRHCNCRRRAGGARVRCIESAWERLPGEGGMDGIRYNYPLKTPDVTVS